MTTNERFKKQVRARMAKTGEKYGAARRALLAQTPAPRAVGWRPGDEWASAPEVPDDSVQTATGRSWDDWCEYIEALPVAAEGHGPVAKYLAAHADLDGWWSQAVTIGWERITGRRVPGQQTDGTFAANKSKTMVGDAESLRALIVDDEARDDLFPGEATELRSKPTTKVLRVSMAEGAALFSIDDKGDGRMRVGVQHTGLPDLGARDAWAGYWSAWLDAVADDADDDGQR